MLAVVSNAIGVSREGSRWIGKAPNFPQGDFGGVWVTTSAGDASEPAMVYYSNEMAKHRKTTPVVHASTTNTKTRETSAPKWQTAVLVASLVLNGVMAILLYGQYRVARDTLERSERPYVLSESAFWRNGTSEAVVFIKNSGKTPAMRNETQIHFMATTDRSDSFRLDWGHMLPAFSSADLAPGASYTTPALTRLSPDQASDVLKGIAVAYVYGTTRYLDGFGKAWSEKYCWTFDATKSQTFLTCPRWAIQD
jgi:hypothetical protein